MKVYLTGCVTYGYYYWDDRCWDRGLFAQLYSLILSAGHDVLTSYIGGPEDDIKIPNSYNRMVAMIKECDGEV